MNKPNLVVVTGRPGSGKTTLAHLLARQIHCPALCRDEFKEGFVTTANRSHEELGADANWKIYETFFAAVELMLSHGITLVAEAAFQHKLWAPKLELLQKMCKPSLVVCTVAPLMARARFIERARADPTRERFHGDTTSHAAKDGNELPVENYDPPKLSVPTLCVDTTEGYLPNIDEIVSFAMRAS